MAEKMSLQKFDKLFLRGYLSIGVAARLSDLTKAAAFVILNANTQSCVCRWVNGEVLHFVSLGHGRYETQRFFFLYRQ